jgi:hypothetical protein
VEPAVASSEGGWGVAKGEGRTMGFISFLSPQGYNICPWERMSCELVQEACVLKKYRVSFYYNHVIAQNIRVPTQIQTKGTS